MHLRVARLSPYDFVAHFSDIWKGRYDDPDALFDFLVEAVDIQLDPPTAFQIGGDLHGERARVSVALCPNPIELVDLYAPPTVVSE